MGAVKLAQAELEWLAELEIVVSRGLAAFVEVGNALFEIRDRGLYRWRFATFEAYCRGRWGLSKTHANRLIIAAEVAEDLTPIGANNTPDCQIPTPDAESQVRPLALLPPEQRADAWKEAATEAGGQPTAKIVQQVVDRKLGKPEPPSRPAGQSKVNGVLRPDPPDIQEARAAGIIAPDVVPEIDEPEAAPQPEPAPESAEAEPSDEEWLAALPLSAKLAGGRLRQFHLDALLYRRNDEARQQYANRTRRDLAAYRRSGGNGGQHAFHLGAFLRRDHPKDWNLCPAPEHGGCGGTGEVTLIGKCPKCFGRGYWIK